MQTPWILESFPRWTGADAAPDGSRLAALWYALAGGPLAPAGDAVDAYGARRGYAELGEPRLAWTAPAALSLRARRALDVRTVAVRRGDDPPVPVRRAASPFDFATTDDAAWTTDAGRLLLRGLELRRVRVTPDSEWTAALPGPVLPGTDVRVLTHPWGARLPAGGAAIDLAGAVTLPAGDPVDVIYADAALSRDWTARGAVSLDGGPFSALTAIDLPNSWDAVGLALDLPRLPGEDNAAYAARLGGVYARPGSPDPAGVLAGVARRLAGTPDDAARLAGLAVHTAPGWAALSEPDGSPSPLLGALLRQLRSALPVGLGDVAWGRARWLARPRVPAPPTRAPRLDDW